MEDKKDKLSSLEELDEKIKKAKGVAEESDKPRKQQVLNPTRVSLELFSGVVVGAALGYYVDKWLGTSPIFLIILFFFGVAGGAMNIYKLISQQDDEPTD